MKKELIQKGKRTTSDCDADADMTTLNEQSSSSTTTADPPAIPSSKKRKTETELSSSLPLKPTILSVSLADTLGNTSGLVLAVCSPAPSAGSFSSVDSHADASLLEGCDLQALCLFEKEKVIELIKANEVWKLFLHVFLYLVLFP